MTTETATIELIGWKAYCDRIREDDPELLRSGLPARFHSRWRVARSFTGLQLDGYRDDTLAGQTSLFRLLLAYSALEQFTKLDPSRKAALGAIADPDLADELRSTLDIEAMTSNENVTGMKGSGKFDDISTTAGLVVFAYALRNIHAHGSATPHGLGVNTARACRAVDALSSKLLSEVEQAFTEYAAQPAQP
ncbi:hypothetical protein [Agromyces seonyuensis]|uniref:Uncharacterized protein n=1 Tax=Agromyces seonyuensis TaxID=2662446 RepID=A0A6I4P0A5_9MICO|nr:hypothetical protein [Agromyces seonyuensis]MWB98175.1 hypothetical protein [Agromyces seonyuensis]